MSTTLAAAAFGHDPSRWPLPTANSTADLWLRAVAAGGQGRYSNARADLGALLRREPSGALASLALSTQASFLRQLGCHRLARGWDGRALAVAEAVADAPAATEARIDAMVGLAADALGVGRLPVSATLLEQARGILADVDEPAPRLAIRLAWVGAELAMAGGDSTTALEHAQCAVRFAEDALPALRRHRVKSDVVLAAALCCAGELPHARSVADAALADTQAYGLVPLRWALACLLADIGSAMHTTQVVAGIREQCAEVITRHGGRWCAH